MRIKSANFITSVASPQKLQEAQANLTCPQLCVVGRSNVGKSTFINTLTGQKRLCKASSEPGRTRLVNFFDLNGGALTLVDLPGYGYANAPKNEKAKWAALIETYLRTSARLCHVLSLVDLRHEPTELDKQMLTYLYAYALPFTVIATKADKLSRAQRQKNIALVSSTLKIGKDDLIVFSSVTGEGKTEVEQLLDRILAATGE